MTEQYSHSIISFETTTWWEKEAERAAVLHVRKLIHEGMAHRWVKVCAWVTYGAGAPARVSFETLDI